jgi:hypothetical protein
MDSYLNLGPKFRESEDIDDVKGEIEAELHCLKARMEMRKREEMEDEDGKYDEKERDAEDNRHRKSKEIREGNKLRMSCQLVTDCKYNIRSFPPRMNENTEELKLQVQREEVLKKTEEFKKKECVKNVQRDGNLSEQQLQGKKKVLKKIQDKEIIISTTDKSGKFVIMTPEGYKEAAEEHLNDEEINWEDINKIEVKMNRHSKQMVKIFSMGSVHDQKDRMFSAYTTKDSRPGEVSFLIKDHKDPKPGKTVPPTRPVCNAREGPNSRLSNLVAQILNKVADAADEGGECKSTEEMLRGILDVNKRIEEMSEEDLDSVKDIQIISMDVKALYPNLKIKECAEIIQKTVENSTLDFDDMDWDEAGKYVAVNYSKSEIEEAGLREVVPTRIAKRGAEPGIAYLDTDTVKKKDKNGKKIEVPKWQELKRRPTKGEQKKILSLIMKVATVTVMSNHCYRFDGKVYRQIDGGPIGLEATQAVARIIMLEFDKRLKLKMTSLSIRMMMYLRYVDDANVAVVPMPEGTKVVDEELVHEEEKVEEDRTKETDRRVAEMVRELADQLMPMIKLEEDFPSNHETKKLPILDLEVWMEEAEVDGRKMPQVMTGFYKKKVSSEATLSAKSSYPAAGTKATLVEETLRRLRNNSPERPWVEKGKHLTKWSLALKRGHHTERFRRDIIEKAVKRYNKELKDHLSGKKKMYRTREERELETELKGGKSSKSNWFRNKIQKPGAEPITSVFRVPVTKGSKLKSMVEEVMRDFRGPRGVKAKVMEEGGRTTKSFLVRGDPFPRKKCHRDNCSIEGREGCGDRCFNRNCNYTISCSRCDDKIEERMEENRRKREDEEERAPEPGPTIILNPEAVVEPEQRQDVMKRPLYGGETSRSLFLRMQRHKQLYKKKTNCLWDHVEAEHEGIIVGDGEGDWKMEVESGDKDPVRRLLREAARLRRMKVGKEKQWYVTKRRQREDRDRGGGGGVGGGGGGGGGGGTRRGAEEGGRDTSKKKKKGIIDGEDRMFVRVEVINDHTEWFPAQNIRAHMTEF